MTGRPKFRWLPSVFDGCSTPTYEIQVDDSCSASGFESCTFPSPEAQTTGLIGLSWRPDFDLPMRSVPPVGTRYYWHVRACRGTSCSAWSRVHYVDVGRVDKDFNGDGYSEVIVGSPLTAKSLAVYEGGPNGTTTLPGLTLLTTDQKHYQGDPSAGDLNGDGFADLVVEDRENTIRRILIFFGGVSGLSKTPSLIIPTDHSTIPSALAAGGDVNGDGYHDLVRTATSGNDDHIEFFACGPLGPTGAPVPIGKYPDVLIQQARRIESSGDLNGDGFVDVAITTIFFSPIVIYKGGPAGPALTSSRVIDSKLQGSDSILRISTAGDLNGDGFADMLAGDPSATDGGVGGAFRIFLGTRDLPSTSPDIKRSIPGSLDYIGFGESASIEHDVNHDGFSDIVVGAPGAKASSQGQVYIFLGSASGIGPTFSSLIENPVGLGGNFGSNLSRGGDVNGDGFPDVAVAAPSFGSGVVFLYHGSTTGLSLTPASTLVTPVGESRFGWWLL